jgi:hypothetical protein
MRLRNFFFSLSHLSLLNPVPFKFLQFEKIIDDTWSSQLANIIS